jgi:hypothetical protein
VSRIVPAVLAALLLAACSATPTKTPTPSGSASPTSKSDDFAPEALSGFRCGWVANRWVASGVLSNATNAAVTYQVTIYVGDAGSSGSGITKRYENIQAGGSIPIAIDKIPATGETGTCHVRVLRVK